MRDDDNESREKRKEKREGEGEGGKQTNEKAWVGNMRRIK